MGQTTESRQGLAQEEANAFWINSPLNPAELNKSGLVKRTFIFTGRDIPGIHFGESRIFGMYIPANSTSQMVQEARDHLHNMLCPKFLRAAEASEAIPYATNNLLQFNVRNQKDEVLKRPTP